MTDQSWRSRRGETGAATKRSRFAARLRLDWWWIAILVLCGSFQIYRGAPLDGVFFLAAGLALLADAAGWLSLFARYPLPRLHVAVSATLGVMAVAVITFAPQFGVAALITVVVIGATALIVAWRDDPPALDAAPHPATTGGGNLDDAGNQGDSGGVERTDARAGVRAAALRRAVRRSAVLWSSAGVFLCLWELASFFLALPSPQAEFEHPPLSDVIDPIVANPVGRAVCATLWLLAGAALLRRGRRP